MAASEAIGGTDDEAEVSEALPDLGDRALRYDIWGCIGRGGMSRVWLARHCTLAIPVVVKTVLAAFESDHAGEARVLSEARLMASISSPRVVRALDAGVHERTPYLVEEYVDGIDVAELDRRRRRALGVGLPLWFVADVMRAACEALHSAHQTGVVHRDVKPSNLFGSPQTGIRLGDFGVAAIAKGRPDGAVIGTLKFMAPEQLYGADPEPTLDVWGAGATAFDLRYGFAPFGSAEEVLDRDRPIPFPPPVTPAEAYFQHVVRGMLERDARARTEDVRDPMRHFAILSEMSSPKGGVTVVDKSSLVVHGCLVRFVQGDVATAHADAIVASAQDSLEMRAGVGDALRRQGGDSIEDAVLAVGRQPLGSCIATSAGTLAAKHVLHAVSAWKEVSCVGRATQRALLVAEELGHRTLALVALGTGAAKVSMETSASAMMTALRYHLTLGATRLREVTIHLWDERSLDVFREVGRQALAGAQGCAVPDVGRPVEDAPVRPEGATWVNVSRGGSGGTRS